MHHLEYASLRSVAATHTTISNTQYTVSYIACQSTPKHDCLHTRPSLLLHHTTVCTPPMTATSAHALVAASATLYHTSSYAPCTAVHALTRAGQPAPAAAAVELSVSLCVRHQLFNHNLSPFAGGLSGLARPAAVAVIPPAAAAAAAAAAARCMAYQPVSQKSISLAGRLSGLAATPSQGTNTHGDSPRLKLVVLPLPSGSASGSAAHTHTRQRHVDNWDNVAPHKGENRA
jgi:hypothetical protein